MSPAGTAKRLAAWSGGGVLIPEVEVAAGPAGRAAGLIGRRGLGPGKALCISPCRVVHTFGMRFALDLIFLAAGGRVVSRRLRVPPNRVVWGGRRARSVLEIEAGWLPDGAAAAGDVITLRA